MRKAGDKISSSVRVKSVQGESFILEVGNVITIHDKKEDVEVK
jgi:hypothetical protein